MRWRKFGTCFKHKSQRGRYESCINDSSCSGNMEEGAAYVVRSPSADIDIPVIILGNEISVNQVNQVNQVTVAWERIGS